MAEAPCVSMAGERLENLAREITCRACGQHYDDPRVLPCCHYFCLGCLQDLLTPCNSSSNNNTSSNTSNSSNTITCPACKAVASGVGGPEQLPPALVVNHLKALHERVAKLEGEEGVQCEMCLDPQAIAFCNDCDEFLCSSCLSSHQKMKAKFSGHKTFSLEDLRSGAKPFPSLRQRQQPLCECPEHKELYKLYCFDCCRLVCRDCIVIEHAQHHYEFVSQSVETTRKTLATTLSPLKQLLSDLTEAAAAVSDTKGEVSTQGVYVARHIHEQFTAMIELLKVRELELLKKTESVVKRKLSRLSAQEQALHVAMTSVVTVTDYVNAHLEVVSDEELLVIQHQLYGRIEEAVSAHKGLKLTPADTPNLAVKIDMEDVLTEACQERAHVYLFPQFPGQQVHAAEMTKCTVQYVVDASREAPPSLDDGNSALATTAKMAAKLVSQVDGSVVKASVFRGGRGLYEVTYTPKVRGQHRLHLTANGDPLASSPLPVFVTTPPECLGPAPSYVIAGLRHPYAAIFDEDQNLLSTESNGMQVRLLLRDADPKGEGRVGGKHRPFAYTGTANPSGIASDAEGNVYVSSASGHSITKYSRTGSCLSLREVQGSRPGELTHPCGLRIIDGELYVCDRNNCRVQVFDRRDLRHLRAFGSPGKGPGQLRWPYDIVQDGLGRLYVSDCDNHRIQVFDKAGRFLRSLGGGCGYDSSSHGNGGGRLKRPMGLAVSQDDRHLFVSEYDSHRVSVYRTDDGSFVSSFGHYGTKEGEFCYPMGLAFDSDGFLYICDQGNNRIQVF